MARLSESLPRSGDHGRGTTLRQGVLCRFMWRVRKSAIVASRDQPLTYLMLKNATSKTSLLFHHNHVAVFVQGDAIDLLSRVKCPANRFVDARTFVEIGRRLLALRDIEMHLGLQFVLRRLRRREHVASRQRDRRRRDKYRRNS